MRMLLAIVLLAGGAATAAAQDVMLTGRTYRSNGAAYTGLPGVDIVVTRGNAVIRQDKSGADGVFSLMIPRGTPFTVAFYGESRVPELQQLAGAAMSRDNVNVTLLTPAEYQVQFGSRLPLAQRLDCDLKLLPEEAKGARDYIQRMLATVR